MLQGREVIFTEGDIWWISEERAAKLHEVKSTFLPCSIRDFDLDFSSKGRIRMRAVARAKLNNFNQLTHNYIENKKKWKKFWKKNLNKQFWKKKFEKIILEKNNSKRKYW